MDGKAHVGARRQPGQKLLDEVVPRDDRLRELHRPHNDKLKEVPVADKAFPPAWAEDHLGGGGGSIRTERPVPVELQDAVPLDEVLQSDEGRLDTVGGGDIHGADVTMNGERRRSVNGFAVCTDAESAVSAVAAVGAARFAVGAVRVE